MHTRPPVSLIGQLVFREFYHHIAYCTKNHDKMINNTGVTFKHWKDNPEYLEAWTNGMTGFPAIDATMRQLHKEGWIHHFGRQLVSYFLTQGLLYQSWEKGAKVFDRLLLDADWSVNNANWQWMSESRFTEQTHRSFSPSNYYNDYDEEGAYVKKYVPELRNYPSKYIYQPWEAPIEKQKEWKAVVGKDYPLPIVGIKKANIASMEQYNRDPGNEYRMFRYNDTHFVQ